MPRDTANVDGFSDMPDLERRILTVLSVLEGSRRLEDSGEYVLSDGRRVRPSVEGIKSILRGGAPIEDKKMDASVERLLEMGLVTKRADCYFLSDVGKKLGRKCRKERMSKGYDSLLSRTETSKAYSVFCERVFGKDLSQYNVLDMEQLNTLIEKLELRPREVALDLGCGNGRIAEYISDLTGAKMVGLDFAAELIKRAQQRAVNKKDRLTYLLGDMDDLSFEEQIFDAVISVDTLYFVENISSTVGKLKSLLKQPNGRLAIFYDQSCDPDESRDVLLPENTKVGKALNSNGLTYETVDYTVNSKGIWLREIEAAEELKELFAKEGNMDIYEDRAQDAKRTLETIENGRQVRCFYLAKLKK
jgi:cyclopropane fatty-acyl-phospholipid synthase-like methyltransferase